ncbi:MAG: hypothetical protein ACI90V_013292, partial [Bacillariaceae sp.]
KPPNKGNSKVLINRKRHTCIIVLTQSFTVVIGVIE